MRTINDPVYFEDLLSAIKKLLRHDKENDIFDKFADDGGGSCDAWPSDELDCILKEMRVIVEAVERKRVKK
jgi:hypothetical protein